MPVRPTFPGVYIEEVPSGVRTIVGVATSVAAFIDYFSRGPMNRAIQLFSFADFEREFGGLDALSEASYGIQQFFLNGGTEAFVIRTGLVDPITGNSFATARIDLQDETTAGSLRINAGRLMKGTSVDDPGMWGNFVRLDVDYDTTDPAALFNLTVSEVSPSGTQPVIRTETFRNLSMIQGQPNSVDAVVNEGSRIVQVQVLANVLATDPAGTGRPARTATLSDALDSMTLAGIAAGSQFNAQLTGDSNRLVTLSRSPAFPPGTPMADQAGAILRDARGLLEAALRAANPNDPRYTNITVQLTSDSSGTRFRLLTGRFGDTGITLSFTNIMGGTAATDLGLVGAGEQINVQQYTLGGTATGFQSNPVVGDNGSLPVANDLIGVRANKTGLFALEDVDIFNILCLPRAADLMDPEPFNVYSAAEAYCLERRAFLILDIPSDIDTVQDMRDWVDDNVGLRSRNAAVYFPRLRIADPLNQFRLRDFAPSGTMAGLYARTDNDRGVWKAPAGIETTLRNVNELSYLLTNPENGSLNPLGINCLRTFPILGTISWGARTLDGADLQASEWKYLPVRRFALFLEESLYRGTQFAVFEPNDEPLWAQIRLNLGAFMQTLFRQGAFQGQTPREAYFVKCDKETTTQNDINQGIVNILVGFAPLKPAEFVIIRISQIAGQIQT